MIRLSLEPLPWRIARSIRELYKRYLPKVIAYVAHNQGTEEEAYTLFREALMVLFRKVKRGKLNLPSSLEAYIAGICRYQWLAKHPKARFSLPMLRWRSSAT